MSVCSFSKVSIQGAFEPKWPFHTDLYCRLFYMASGDEQVLFCAFDTLNVWAKDTARFRKEVGEACGIPAKSIVFHELQVHAAPQGKTVSDGMDEIISRVIPEVKAMKANAKPFTCEVCESYFGDECSFNREQYVEGLGGVTVWTGMGFDEKGKPCTDNEAILLLQDYRPNLETLKTPLYFDNPNDPFAYLFVFRGEDGKVIGTLSRFAAHPDVAVLFELRPVTGKAEMYRYDFDWPGYLSTRLEKDYGGTSIYLNGPCGDLSTKKGYDGIDNFIDSDKECQRLGNWFAEKLSASFKENGKIMKNSDFLRTETFTVTVPMRDDMPRTNKEAMECQAALQQKAREEFNAFKVDPSKTPAQVKRKVDDYWKSLYNGIMSWQICGFDDEELSTRQVKIDIPCVRFGEYLFVGVPGESLTETATWLRSAFTGSKTIPLDQCNGYYSYMATPRTLTLGGYTYWCSWVNRETVPSMQKQLLPLVKKFLED